MQTFSVLERGPLSAAVEGIPDTASSVRVLWLSRTTDMVLQTHQKAVPFSYFVETCGNACQVYIDEFTLIYPLFKTALSRARETRPRQETRAAAYDFNGPTSSRRVIDFKTHLSNPGICCTMTRCSQIHRGCHNAKMIVAYYNSVTQNNYSLYLRRKCIRLFGFYSLSCI